MTCEAAEDDCSNNCCQDFDADLEGSWPCIVNVTTLSNSDNYEHNNSPVFPTGVFSSTAEHLLTSPVSEMPLKCNSDCYSDCYVVLERLPESLVQAAQTCKILVSKLVSDKTASLNSSGIDTTVATPTCVLSSDETVKTEPDESSAVVADEQASVSHLTTEQHSMIVRSSVNIPVMTDVATMTDVAPVTSDTASRRSCGPEQDISVILLNSAQQPKTSASHVTGASVAPPHDVSRFVLSMLRQQNVSLQRARDNECVNAVMQDENEQRRGLQAGSHCVASDSAVLRQMLENANRAKASLETQLKAEQAKVKYLRAEVASLKATVRCDPMQSDASDTAILEQLLENTDKAKAALEMQLKAEQAKVKYLHAEVTCLKDTVKKLSGNGNNSECMYGGGSSVMD